MDIRKQLIILILVLLCAPVSAQKKEKLITLKFTNIPLSEAMPKVEKQSGYTFFYESQQIDIKQKVSLNVKNETINKTIASTQHTLFYIPERITRQYPDNHRTSLVQ